MEAFDPEDFPARVIVHVPEPRRHLVRYYGWYSNVSRGKRRKEEAELERPAAVEAGSPCRDNRDRTPDARALRLSWAQLIKRIYEVDPLVCPSCGRDMKVIAFILDHGVVDKILRHLRRTDDVRGRGPPQEAQLSAVS